MILEVVHRQVEKLEKFFSGDEKEFNDILKFCFKNSMFWQGEQDNCIFIEIETIYNNKFRQNEFQYIIVEVKTILSFEKTIFNIVGYNTK
jgi:hypothetical protein